MAETWTPERVREAFETVKSWGRWGDEDERGALNLITPAKVREAAASTGSPRPAPGRGAGSSS